MQVVSDVMSNINLERIRMFNRRHGLRVSGTKNELVNLIKESVVSGIINQTEVEEFLAEEIAHGKNRILFVSSFPDSAVANLQNVEAIRDALRMKGLRTVNFNNLHTISCPENLELAYLKIHEEQLVNKISLCFSKTVIIKGAIDEEGEELPPRNETEYVWVDILPTDKKIHIKMRQRSGNVWVNNSRIKELYDEISTIVRETFSLAPKSMEGVKNILYKMFKDLTETAEQPFTAAVAPLEEKITTFAEEVAGEVGLHSPYDPVDLPHRLKRLLERALIQQDFHIYEGYFEGKRGIVNRIYFSDATGASVNARSSEVEEGIAVADIYFDTKESIEKLQKFDKIWITWFYKRTGQPLEKIETKFEVAKEHFVIHFLYAYTTKEMQNHVFSNFKHFEELPPDR
ncbi:hypothetical protein FZC78_02795 [Rossellomorea vietnamensis]|uniref:SAP domain-containing protein n=1 Tax=Rossellomorea vietnamensis TaxID=218284 RepID=A0A5D4NYD8_9BACI|nr:hypothetical protein [Rossellomorea vietnamensis]TYS18484.1 hypothetical protein FZC78_02795 [Rossellomorea vietnamensis]